MTLAAGAHVTITPDDATDTLTIAASGGGSSTGLTAVDTIAQLKAISTAGLVSGDVQQVNGYYAAKDGGGGIFRWNGTLTTADNGGTVITPTSNPASGRWERVYDRGPVDVRWFGAKGIGSSGASEDQTAFSNALSFLGTSGDLFISAGTYNLSGGFTVGAGVRIFGNGVKSSIINHTGNNTLFTALDNAYGTAVPDHGMKRGWADFQIFGNFNTSAKGIVHGNAYGAVLRGLRIDDYTAGTGIELANTLSWTEGTSFEDCLIQNCNRGIACTISGTGVSSFSNTSMRNVYLVQNAANQVGLWINPGAFMYASDLHIKLWLSVNNAVGMQLGTDAVITDSTYGIYVEVAGGVGSMASGYGGIKTSARSVLAGRGVIYPLPSMVDSSAVPFHSIDPSSNISLPGTPAAAIHTLAPAADVYYPIATLPPSSNGTFDKLIVEVVGGPEWDSGGLVDDKIIFSNRNAFKYFYCQGGTGTRANLRIVAYSQANGSVQVWVRSLASQFVHSMVRAWGSGFSGGAAPTEYGNAGWSGANFPQPIELGMKTTIAPSGSVVFDSATTSPNYILGVGHVVAGGSAPTIATGSGAGTTGSASIAGTDTAGLITVTTGGTMTGSNATVVTVTFNTAYAAAPRVVISPASSQAAALSGATQVFVDSASVSTTAFVIKTGTTALTSGQTLRWHYHVIQ